MCGLHAYQKHNDKSTDATNFDSGRPLPDYSIINTLVYLCVSIKFIDTWINALATNFTWHCCAYKEKIK